MKKLALLIALICATTATADGMHSTAGRVFPHHGSSHSDNINIAMATFDLNPNATGSGPSLASSSLTVNGTAMTTILDCRGEQFTGSSTTMTGACTTGGTFNYFNGVGAGQPSSGAAVPFTSSTARGITGGGAFADVVQADDPAVADITTEDFVIELVTSTTTTTGTVPFDKQGGGVNPGYSTVFVGGAGGFKFSMRDDSGHFDNLTAGSITPAVGAWYHLMIFVDRSASVRFYANGANVGSGAVTATGSLTTTAPAALLGQSGAINGGETGGTIASATMWKCASCLNTTAEQDSIAAQRFSQIAGLYPVVAAGAATPTADNRASLAYVDIDRDGDGVRRLFLLGNGWLSVARRNVGGTYVSGYLDEVQSTNLVLQSQALDNASWTKTNLTASGNTGAAPDMTTTAESLAGVPAAGSVEHYAREPVVLTATTHCLSVFYEPLLGRHLWLRDATIANGTVWFSPTGTVETAQAGVSSSGIDTAYVNGFFRAYMCFTGTAAAHNLDVGYSNADASTTFDEGAAGSADMFVWGAQVEAQPIPTSYIATTTATATRSATDLRYAVASNVPQGTGSIVESVALAKSASAFCYFLTVGSSSNDGLFFSTSATTPTWSANNGGVSQWGFSGTTNVMDGALHTLRGTYATNAAHLYVDGTEEGPGDTTANPPTPATSFYIGERETTTLQPPSVLISRLRLYASPIPGSAGAP